MAKKIIEERPPQKAFKEISTSVSPYYQESQLRPYNPADLYQNKDWSIYDDIRADDQVNAILKIKKYVILSTDWMIEGENEDVNNFITYALKEKLNKGLNRRLYEILTAIDYGFSITEKVLGVDKDGKYGTKIIFKDLKVRPPHSFELHTDEHGNLIDIIQYQNNGNISLDPKKFIHYPYQEEFGNPYGNADINKSVYRAYWSKEAIIRFWNIYLERFGMPIVLSKYPKGMGGYASELDKIMKNIQAKTGISLPVDIEMEFLEAKRGGDGGYDKAIDKYNMLIARSMLVPDLMGLGGAETSGGSYSLGQEQFGVFYIAIQNIRNELEQLVNENIVNPLIKWNYGSDIEAEFKFQEIDTSRKAEYMRLFLELIKTGSFAANKDQLNWFLDSIDVPVIDEENPVDGLASIVEPEKEKEPETIPIEKEIKDESEQQETKELEKDYTKKYYRKLTEYEKKEDFNFINQEGKELSQKWQAEIGKIFADSISRITQVILDKKMIEGKKFAQIEKIFFPNKKGLERAVKKMLIDGAKFGKQSVKQIKEYQTETDTLDSDQTKDWVDVNSKYIADAAAADVLTKTNGTLIDGIRAGRSQNEIMKEIDDNLKGYEYIPENVKGADVKEGAAIALIVSTNLAKSFNESRIQEFNKRKDKIRAYQFSAILDDRTSNICMQLDKKIIKPAEMMQYNPPIHYNCRSQLVPVFNEEEFDGYTDAGDFPQTEKVKGGFLKLV